MTRQLLLAGAIALIAAGCHKPTTPAADSSAAISASATPDAHPAATIPTPANEAAAPDFVEKAAVSDMFEVEASKVAEKRSANPDVKAFAKMMISAHTKSTAALKAAIAKSGQALSPPAALPDNKAKDIQDLRDADAKDFDKKFMDAQVDGHQAALDLMARYARDGDVADIKTFAADTAPVVQAHLDKAKAIRDALK